MLLCLFVEFMNYSFCTCFGDTLKKLNHNQFYGSLFASAIAPREALLYSHVLTQPIPLVSYGFV